MLWGFHHWIQKYPNLSWNNQRKNKRKASFFSSSCYWKRCIIPPTGQVSLSSLILFSELQAFGSQAQVYSCSKPSVLLLKLFLFYFIWFWPWLPGPVIWVKGLRGWEGQGPSWQELPESERVSYSVVSDPALCNPRTVARQAPPSMGFSRQSWLLLLSRFSHVRLCAAP